MEEVELIKKLKAGENYAYKVLYEKYYSCLCNYVHKLSKDRKLSEDVVQDVFINLYIKRKSINISNSLQNYLFTCCYNQFLQQLRKQKIKFDILDEIKWQAINDYVNVQEEEKEGKLKKMHALIDELPPKCKEVFVKNKLQKIKYKDIAADLNISIKTVEGQMSKAFYLLRNKTLVFLIFIISNL